MTAHTHRRLTVQAALFAVLAVPFFAQVAGGQRPNTPRRDSATTPAYRVVASRALTRTAVISPQDRTDAGLRRLGPQLRSDYAVFPVIFVWVFDDLKAAMVADPTASRPGSADRYWQRHFIAGYEKNRMTGHHEYYYWPNGGLGKQLNVSY
ncbi:MAG: hypothetical protein ACR2OG_07120 [Gemmatimonadaceae bacterium]